MMEKLELNGHITDEGAFMLHNRKRFEQWCHQHPGKNVTVRFSRRSNKRTSQQNRYYFGVVIKEITLRLRDLGHTWMEDEDTHSLMKLKFHNEQIVSEHGEVMELPKSTSEMTKVEFLEYVDRIRMWAADFLSIDIPDPNAKLELEF